MNLRTNDKIYSQTIRKTITNILTAVTTIKLLIDLHPNPRKRERMKAAIKKKLLETIEKNFK